MSTVIEHYAGHLAPVYLWMAGGLDAAMARGEAEIDAICPGRADGLVAVDLGAGFGMHAIPLAHRGYAVVAVDTSAALLAQLREQAGALPARAVEDDLSGFRRHLDGRADLILCMGDTLTHLPALGCVEQLFADAAGALRPGGSFIATFRDYTTALAGNARFIPVRSDSERILTCFLEYGDDCVTVHDILHERSGASWSQRVGAYRKLRLPTDWVVTTLQAKGFSVRSEPGPAGMVRVVATAPAQPSR
jgi:SAM-dependent methyltransferase